jgi:hypothetical protein
VRMSVTRGAAVAAAIGAVTQVGICGKRISKALDRHVQSPVWWKFLRIDDILTAGLG